MNQPLSQMLKRELLTWLALVAIMLALWLFPYSLVATLWNGVDFDAALATYLASVRTGVVEEAIYLAALVAALQFANWFEYRRKQPNYSDRTDGYRANADD